LAIDLRLACRHLRQYAAQWVAVEAERTRDLGAQRRLIAEAAELLRHWSPDSATSLRALLDGGVRQELATGAKGMAKPTTKLSAQDWVILFCVATGIEHAAVGILVQAMQSMAVRVFIVHDRQSDTYALTDSGRATPTAILEDAGLE
jgi:hypothetical protein